MTAPCVYACFDAVGSKNPAATDLKYYFLLRAWSHRAPLAGTFVDVHGSGRLKPADLRRELTERMRRSDLLLVILSERTAASGGLLSWEIDVAAGQCGLPNVCSYTRRGELGAERVNFGWWPDALRRSVTGGRADAIHIPFHPGALARVFRRGRDEGRPSRIDSGHRR